MKKLQLFEPEPFPAQTTSIEFNGVDESMRDTTQQSHAIADKWSLMMWIRRRSDTQGLTANNNLFLLSGGTPNRIHIRAFGSASGDPVRVELHDTGGTVFKNSDWNTSVFPSRQYFRLTYGFTCLSFGTELVQELYLCIRMVALWLPLLSQPVPISELWRTVIAGSRLDVTVGYSHSAASSTRWRCGTRM